MQQLFAFGFISTLLVGAALLITPHIYAISLEAAGSCPAQLVECPK